MDENTPSVAEVQDLPVTTIDGRVTTFGELTAGRVALVVNVASRCGLAPQYERLEALQRRYADRGFTVVGFPSNQFLQELGSEDRIQEYCSTTWGVTFPMSERVRVNGRDADPIYRRLVEVPKENGKPGRITWNFEKFVIAPNGEVRRFGPRTEPDAPQVIEAIERALGPLEPGR
ncbi:glutathione peroxidase [Leucobacter weissii]|uniref:Glutathione peroxidase n=1 Tax=Leucobacter weissii TaxID=1983706 RepID=A0A939MHE9_9MICO|nr:glutathione peroxidase [Leucobacter weissii]MBO1900978.1 glutathione peroxidase [Leucobacter weissii]